MSDDLKTKMLDAYQLLLETIAKAEEENVINDTEFLDFMDLINKVSVKY